MSAFDAVTLMQWDTSCMIHMHSVRIGYKARGEKNESTSVCVVECYSPLYAIKTGKKSSRAVYNFLWNVYYINIYLTIIP